MQNINNNPNKGIKQPGEIMRSAGYGWILCKRGSEYILHVIVDGSWFTQKQMLYHFNYGLEFGIMPID